MSTFENVIKYLRNSDYNIERLNVRGGVDRGEIYGIVAKAQIIGMSIENIGCLTLIYDSYSKQMDIICDDDIKIDIGRFLFLNSKYKSIKFSNVDTSEVMDMVGMFSGCTRLEELDITCMDINKLRLATDMFTGIKIKRLDLSNFNLANVYNTVGMFNFAKIDELIVRSADFYQLEKMFTGAEIGRLVINKMNKSEFNINCITIGKR